MWSFWGVVVLMACLVCLAARRPGVPWPGGAGLSLCLIVGDQEDRVEGLVAELLRLAGRLRGGVVDVVVVDAGSTDGTAAVLARLGRRYPAVKIARWPDDTPQGEDLLAAACALCAGGCILLCQARSERLASPGR